MSDQNPTTGDELDWLLRILRRFHAAALALRNRSRVGKAELGYRIEDEYDVQDLLFAILKPLVPDLEKEDPIPKTAGCSGRVDLSSRGLGVIIEIKFPSTKQRASEIARECSERLVIYSRWPDLRHLVFFVYDPHNHLPDADTFLEGIATPSTSWNGKSFRVTPTVSPWEMRREATLRLAVPLLPNVEVRNLDSARKVIGHVTAIREGKLILAPISWDEGEGCWSTSGRNRDSYTTSFQVDQPWLEEHLDRSVEVLIVNNVVVKVTPTRLPETPWSD